MNVLLGTVFMASLFGGLHCAGMCGPFVAMAVSGNQNSLSFVRQAAYHCGRLSAYIILGVFAGWFGMAINRHGDWAGIPALAAKVSGVLMMTWGLVMLLRLMSVKLPNIPTPAILQLLNIQAHRGTSSWTPAARAASIGLFSALLPCGWLYAFVFTAAGTAHPLWGALTMAVFWLGTLPALVAVGLAAQKWGGQVTSKLPWIAATALFVVGLNTFVHRGFTLHSHPALSTSSFSTEVLTQHIHQAENAPLPCCEEANHVQ